MNRSSIVQAICQGRTDRVFELFQIPDWQEIIQTDPSNILQWFVYYNDTTALRAVLRQGGDLAAIDLNAELCNAAFFGHWKVCDFLLEQGADVNCRVPDTGETPLHCALCKAGRPFFIFTVRLLLDHGADPNVTTIPGIESASFMRDVRTKGETPLHRAAAYADADTIDLLLETGADRGHVMAMEIRH